MGAHTLIVDLTIVLGVAAATAVLCRLVRQPAIVGYLLAGLIVGPYLPIPLFADSDRIRELSELGVILVMFSVGVEFSLARLLRLLPTSGFAAVVEIGAMGWIGHTFGQLWGRTALESLFLGASVAISSTIVVAKMFDEFHPERRQRELILGILVVQDVVAIAMIAALTAVASGAGVSADAILDTVMRLALTFVLLLAVGLLLIPRLVRAVHRIATPEILVVTAAAIAFGLALLAEELGYSVALGAFLAGMLVAESGRRHEIEHLIRPIKDLFAAIFFVSVGMAIDPALALRVLVPSLLLSLCIVVGQLLTVSFAGVLSGNGLRRSVVAGAALGQIGEFAFIIIGLGAVSGVIGPELQPVVVTAAVLTTFSTPLLFRAAEPLAAFVDHHIPRPLVGLLGLYEAWLERLRRGGVGAGPRASLRRHGRVVLLDGLVIAAIVGAASLQRDWILGLLGESLDLRPQFARLLLGAAILGLSLPFALGVVRNGGRIGLVVGEELLPPPGKGLDLGQAPRNLVVAAFQVGAILAVGVPLVALTQPLLDGPWGAVILGAMLIWFGVGFFRTARDLGGHVKASAQVVLELLSRQQDEEAEAPTPDLDELLPGLGPLKTVVVSDQCAAAGSTLRDLDLHARTGAAILVLRHEESGLVSPGLDEPLHPGDTLAVVGTREAIARARRLLASGSTEESGD